MPPPHVAIREVKMNLRQLSILAARSSMSASRRNDLIVGIAVFFVVRIVVDILHGGHGLRPRRI
jgi:hypothetical protein